MGKEHGKFKKRENLNIARPLSTNRGITKLRLKRDRVQIKWNTLNYILA